jgi:acyl-CoA synthetase (AMP-forming)/AMP-acid ligase II
VSDLSIPIRLRQHAERMGDRPAVFFRSAEGWVPWTWNQYWETARRMAGGLRAFGVHPGDRVLVLAPDVKAAVASQLGAWTLGAIPAQLGLPDRLANLDAFVDELGPTLQRLETRTLLVGRSIAALLTSRDEVRILVAEELMEQPPEEPASMRGAALMQLTSGSTGHPRAVVVPHDRVARHLEHISERLPSDDASVGVTWLPLCHDMGLIGGLLYPCWNGFPVYLTSPMDFRRSPYAWLQTLSQVRATHTAAPPSGFAVCLRLAERAEAERLDLSTLTCAMVGAEPIPPRVLGQFADAFAPCGFRPESFFPVYGLAEATVAVTFPDVMTPTRLDTIDRERFEQEGVAESVHDDRPQVQFVGVGSPLTGTELRIRDREGQDVPERIVGKIWFRSDSMMLGYYGDEEATAAVLQDGWLDTGDLGYVAGGALFVTGRVKDVIIARGRTLVPSAIEEIVATLPGVRKDGVAAVGVPADARATEQVCVVAETRVDASEHSHLAGAVRDALKVRGISVDHVIFVPPKTLPKTSSGKIKRSLVVEHLRSGQLPGLPALRPH